MQSSPQFASTSLSESDAGTNRSRRLENHMYQAFTVAAMLLLLVTLWLF